MTYIKDGDLVIERKGDNTPRYNILYKGEWIANIFVDGTIHVDTPKGIKVVRKGD